MLSASTLQMKFMQRAAAKRGETVNDNNSRPTPSPASSPHLGPSTPARFVPGTPVTPGSTSSYGSPVMVPVFGEETQWTLASPGSPSPASFGTGQLNGSAGTPLGTSDARGGKPGVRISYAQSYMAFMQDDTSSEEEDRADQPGSTSIKPATSGLGAGAESATMGRGRLGYGEYAPKAKTPQTPNLITEGFSNGMKPRTSSSSSSARTPNSPYASPSPLNRSAVLHPHLRPEGGPGGGRERGKANGKASPLSRVVGHVMSSNRISDSERTGLGSGSSPASASGSRSGTGAKEPSGGQERPAMNLNSHGFAKPAGFEGLPARPPRPSASGQAGPSTPTTPTSTPSRSQRKNNKKRQAPMDGVQDPDEPSRGVSGSSNQNGVSGSKDVIDLVADDDAGGGDDSGILPNGARANKRSKKNKKKNKQRADQPGVDIAASGGQSLMDDGGKGDTGEEEDDVERLMREMEEEMGGSD